MMLALGRKGGVVKRWNLVAIVVCLLAGIAALRPLSASAQVPGDTPLRVRFAWPSPPTFCADTALLPAGLSADTFVDWVQQSVDAWNVTTANVELRFSGRCPTPWAEDNARNEVAFTVFDPADTAIGYASTTTLNGVVVEADVTLSLEWVSTADACWRHVMVHEFGHVLGFSHSVNETDTMGYGPCAVVSPSPSEVALLEAAYGVRPAPLAVVTAAPDGSTVFTLEGVQRDYPDSPGSYFHTAGVTVSGGGAMLLRAPACFTSDAPATVECVEETVQDDGFWPAALRYSQLPQVGYVSGRSTIRAASSLDHWSGPVLACNTVGCAQPVDVRMGDLRVNGEGGVDFAYLVFPLPDGRVRVQFLNVSFYYPPYLLDVAATFEVRRAGVAGAPGLLGSCSARLGRTCTVNGDFDGLDLELVHFSSSANARTGVSIDPLAATATEPADDGDGEDVAAPDGAVLVGSLPARGVGLVLWGGGSIERALEDPRIGAVFVSSGGVLRGYIAGAPGFVNALFLASVGDEIGANTPVVIVVR